MSTANRLYDRLLDEAEAIGPVSESSRPTEPRSWTVPAPPRLGTLSAFELEELEELEDLENRRAESGFDFHDTIPAPPWLGELSELGEAEAELLPRLPPFPVG